MLACVGRKNNKKIDVLCCHSGLFTLFAVIWLKNAGASTSNGHEQIAYALVNTEQTGGSLCKQPQELNVTNAGSESALAVIADTTTNTALCPSTSKVEKMKQPSMQRCITKQTRRRKRKRKSNSQKCYQLNHPILE